MRILVIGATGFVGRRLCRGLIGRDHQVIALRRATSPLKPLQGIPVEHRIGDVTSPEDLRNAMRDVDAVYHLAAPHNPWESAGKLYATIVEGTRYVMEAALEAGVQRVIYTSAAASLGCGTGSNALQTPEVLDENHAWNLPPELWPFGYAKYLAELEVQKAVALGLPVVILNPSYILGPGDMYRKSQSMFHTLATRRIPFYLPGGINIVHITDVVRAHMSALSFGEVGERYLLAGMNIQIRYFQELIARASGNEVPRVLIPAGTAKRAIPILRMARSLLNLPVDVNLLKLAGNTFYYSAAKSMRGLKLPPYRGAEEIVNDTLAWINQADDITLH